MILSPRGFPHTRRPLLNKTLPITQTPGISTFWEPSPVFCQSGVDLVHDNLIRDQSRNVRRRQPASSKHRTSHPISKPLLPSSPSSCITIPPRILRRKIVTNGPKCPLRYKTSSMLFLQAHPTVPPASLYAHLLPGSTRHTRALKKMLYARNVRHVQRHLMPSLIPFSPDPIMPWHTPLK
jgi:hypothetical protein